MANLFHNRFWGSQSFWLPRRSSRIVPSGKRKKKNQSKWVLRFCTWLPSIHRKACVHTHTPNHTHTSILFFLFVSCDEQNLVSLLCANDLSGSWAEKSCESSVGLATADERVRRSGWIYNPLLVDYGIGPPPFPSEGSHISPLETRCLMDLLKLAHTLTLLVSMWLQRLSLRAHFDIFS